MALSLLNTYSANNNLNVTSVTVPNVVVSGSNTITIVQLCTYENTSSANRVGVSVVRNSENFTRLDSATIDDGETDGQRIETWYKLGASTGTSDIVCTVTGACNQVSAFVSVVENAVQSAPSVIDTQEDATGTSHALTLTTTKNGSFIMGAIYTWDATVSALGTNQTSIASLDSGYLRGSYEIVGDAGNHDHSYTTGSNSRCVYSAVAITPILTDVAVRTSSSNSAATGTAMSVTAPTGTQAGDVVVCVVHGNGQTTIVDNNGSTPFTEDLNDYKPNVGSGHTVSIFTRRIQSGDPTTYNFTLGATNRWSVVAVAIKDVDPTNIYDVTIFTEAVDASDTGTLEIDSITTNTDKAIHFVTLSWDTSATGTITGPAGYTNASSINTNQPTAVYHKTIASAGATGAQTISNTEFGTRIGTAFAIKNTVVAAGGDLSINKSESITVAESFYTLVRKESGGISFDGSGDYGQIANFAGIDALTDGTVTIEGWVNQATADSPQYATFFSMGTDAAWAARLQTNDGGTSNTGINFGYDYTVTKADGYQNGVMTNGTWSHLAVVFTNGAVTAVYINGTEMTYTQNATPSGTPRSLDGASFNIGRIHTFTTYDFKGYIGGFVRVWKTARTGTQINENKGRHIAGNTDLIINLMFKEFGGITLDNEATSGADMTLVGTTTWVAGPDIEDAGILISESESISVADTPVVTLPDALKINKSEAISVADTPTTSTAVSIGVSDNVAVAEAVVMNLPVTINKSEAISVTDTSLLTVPDPLINVSDSISVTDTPEVSVPVSTETYINVSEAVAVGDSATVTITPLFINVSESVNVVDATLREVTNPGISVSESITLTEAQGITPSTPPLQVSDSVGVTDTPTLDVADPQITVAEAISVADTPLLGIAGLSEAVASESIAVADSPILLVSGPSISVSDEVAIDEYVELFQPELVVSELELVTVLTSVSFTFENTISVEDNITVTDSSSTFKHVRNKSVIAGIKPTRVGVNAKPDKPEFVVGQSQHGYAPIKGGL